MKLRDQVAEALADALLAGPAGTEDFVARCAQVLGRRHRWLRPLCKRVLLHFGPGLHYTRRRELIGFICGSTAWRKAWESPDQPRLRQFLLPVSAMGPRLGVLAGCVLPELPTPADLAAWLGVTISELQWYADLRGMIRVPGGALCHYRYRWIPKRHGEYRLIESPKPALRAMQRKILHEILDRVPPHPAAHGFRRGHSCLSHVAPHVGKRVVLRMDLRNFFGSVPAGRVTALFKALGYPEETARLLAGLCTNRIPAATHLGLPGAEAGFIPPWHERKQLAQPHLPQGAPTSPALANLCALHLDFRLAALADKVGAAYTRYADDLAFSGAEPLRRGVAGFGNRAAAIVLDEGFEVNFRKTRVMHRSDRQILTGIVVNEKVNVDRREFDRLKAILHNCRRFGPDSQNHGRLGDFRAHLQGRIIHLKRLNRPRGQRLELLFEQIQWNA